MLKGRPAHRRDDFLRLDGLLMEANYDLNMLANGRYPERVKRRIASDLGHLSNEQAGGFLAEIGHPDLTVVIGHVSEENNHPDLLLETFEPQREGLRGLMFATQDGGAEWQPVAAGAADAAGPGQKLAPGANGVLSLG